MSAITEAVTLVNQQARMFKAVQTVAEALRQCGDVEAFHKELTSQVAQATSDLAQLRADHVAVSAAKGAELKDLNAKIDAARVQLGEVNAQLAAANEAVRKMLAGG